MKKVLPYIFLLCLLLSGCNKQSQQLPAATQPHNPIVNESEPTATQETTDANQDFYTQQPMYGISLPIVTEHNESGHGSFTFQNIHLICQKQDVADKIILDYLNRQDAHRKSYNFRQDTQYNIIYQPMRLDSNIASLYGQSVLHEGKNHPIITCEAVNYSMLTGEVLTLGSILKNNLAYERLQDALLFAAETAMDEKQLFAEYPQIIAERFSENPSFDEDWFFTNSGISFFFEPYEIAPYVSGVVILEIPYDRLLNIIDDRYFPDEVDLSEGVLKVLPINNVNLEEYTQIAEVYVNGYSEGVFVFCDGLVRDIRIEILSDAEHENAGTIFAANTLSPADGMILMYNHQEESPILRITYLSGSNVITKDLYFSDDGAVVLA